jgi:glycosyltransferase involved in cell wall biosynthesis
MDKVTVIVPFYNVERYIDKCISSIVNQTYKNIEIICIDDFSTDKSLSIVESYADNDDRIIIVKHDKNMGTGAGRNTGLKSSSGSYLCFVDGDDFISERYVELLYKNIRETGADIAICGYLCHKGGTNYPCYKDFVKELIQINETKDNVLEIVDKFPSSACIKMYSFNFIDSNDIVHHESQYYEDVIFWLNVAYYSNKISVIPEKLYYYRQRSESKMTLVSQQIINARFEFIGVIDNFVKGVVIKTPGVDVIKVEGECLLLILKHLHYGAGMLINHEDNRRSGFYQYFYDKIDELSVKYNWPGLRAIFSIYCENKSLSKELSKDRSELESCKKRINNIYKLGEIDNKKIGLYIKLLPLSIVILISLFVLLIIYVY